MLFSQDLTMRLTLNDVIKDEFKAEPQSIDWRRVSENQYPDQEVESRRLLQLNLVMGPKGFLIKAVGLSLPSGKAWAKETQLVVPLESSYVPIIEQQILEGRLEHARGRSDVSMRSSRTSELSVLDDPELIQLGLETGLGA